MQPASGPTLLGFDVIWVATLLSAVATLAVLVALYAATTVRDPMARRVKALNERREQLKAGIAAPPHDGQRIVTTHQPADTARAPPAAARGAGAQGAWRPPGAAPGGHGRLDQQAQEHRQQEPGCRQGPRH